MTYCVRCGSTAGWFLPPTPGPMLGVDNIAQFRKVHTWKKPGERVLVLLTAATCR